MKLTQLAARPQLIRVELDDEEIQETYGEALEFWILDRQPMEKFIQIATTQTENPAELVRLVNGMILDEDGNTVIKDDEALPHGIMMKAIAKVVEILGK